MIIESDSLSEEITLKK